MDCQGSSSYIVLKTARYIEIGCDGVVVSGKAIEDVRHNFPNIDIVSPGIRPAYLPQNEHKRSTTPAKAIKLGADHIVVGRPITTSKTPYDSAKKIIDEIEKKEY